MLTPRVLSFLLGSVVLFSNGSVSAQEALDIQIDFSGDASFQPLFENAALIWEAILPSYQDGTNFFGGRAIPDQFVVDAGVVPLAAGTLATAGGISRGFDGSFSLNTGGILQFNSATIDNLEAEGNLQNIIIHEIGHLLGFEPGNWQFNDNLGNIEFIPSTNETDENGNPTGNLEALGQFIGTNSLAAYNAEFGLNETFIPIENNGGPGTQDAHFDEEFFGLATPNGTQVDPPAGSSQAQEFRFGLNQGEILTGVFNPNVPIFLSDTTGAIFQDIGFNVDFDAITAFNNGELDNLVGVPEPSSASFLLLSLVVYGFRRRRS